MLDESMDSVPITLNQERRLAYEEASLLTGSRLIPFHLMRALQLDGVLDEQALQRALELLVQRHGALRTAFVPVPCDRRAARIDKLLKTGVVEPGMYRQVVCRESRPSLEIRRLSSEAAALDDIVFARSAQDTFTAPFEYARPPLSRAVLLERPRTPHTLLLVVHHLIGDRESMPVLQRDLQHCYDHVVSNGESPLGPAPTPYETVMRSFDEVVRGPDITNTVSYWQRQWSTYRAAQLQRANFDCPLPKPTGPIAFGEVRRTLDRDALERIDARARASKVTVYILGAAALAILLAEYTRTPAVVMWSNVDNRWKLGADDSIAWLVHSHMLGIDVRPGCSGDQHLANVRAVVLGAMSHGHLPLSELWSREGRSLANGFRVTFGLTKVDPAEATTCGRYGLSMHRVAIPGMQSLTSDLDFLVLQGPDSISFAARYWTCHFSAAAIQKMVDRYVEILERLVACPSTPLQMS